MSHLHFAPSAPPNLPDEQPGLPNDPSVDLAMALELQEREQSIARVNSRLNPNIDREISIPQDVTPAHRRQLTEALRVNNELIDELSNTARAVRALDASLRHFQRTVPRRFIDEQTAYRSNVVFITSVIVWFVRLYGVSVTQHAEETLRSFCVSIGLICISGSCAQHCELAETFISVSKLTAYSVVFDAASYLIVSVGIISLEINYAHYLVRQIAGLLHFSGLVITSVLLTEYYQLPDTYRGSIASSLKNYSTYYIFMSTGMILMSAVALFHLANTPVDINLAIPPALREIDRQARAAPANYNNRLRPPEPVVPRPREGANYEPEGVA